MMKQNKDTAKINPRYNTRQSQIADFAPFAGGRSNHMHQKFGKIAHVVPEISSMRDRQRHTQTY